MKPPFISRGLFISACIFMFYIGLISQQKAPYKKAIYIEYFKNGDTLYPDIVCSDTLIVWDNVGLNKVMGEIKQGINREKYNYGDSEYDSLFHAHCKILK